MYNDDKKPFRFSNTEEALLKEHSALLQEQDEWGRKLKKADKKYLEECKMINITFDDEELIDITFDDY